MMQKKIPSFDTNLMGAARRRKKLWPKNCPKMDFTGVKIAWVIKSSTPNSTHCKIPGKCIKILKFPVLVVNTEFTCTSFKNGQKYPNHDFESSRHWKC